jgi:hypothetical protein
VIGALQENIEISMRLLKGSNIFRSDADRRPVTKDQSEMMARLGVQGSLWPHARAGALLMDAWREAFPCPARIEVKTSGRRPVGCGRPEERQCEDAESLFDWIL